jgi:hypothetical protein
MKQKHTDPLEVELKFRVDDPAIFAAFSHPTTLGDFC